MNKKLVYQVGNNKKLYYGARPTKYQDVVIILQIVVLASVSGN